MSLTALTSHRVASTSSPEVNCAVATAMTLLHPWNLACHLQAARYLDRRRSHRALRSTHRYTIVPSAP